MPSAFFLSLLPIPFPAALGRPTAGDGQPYTVRRGLARCFAAHGRHVAANQIRVLLICSVVMTTLLYPALAIHYATVSAGANPSAVDRPPSLALTPLLRPLFSPGARMGGDNDDRSTIAGEGFPWLTGPNPVGNLDGWTLTDARPGVDEGVRLETLWLGEVARLRGDMSSSPSPSVEDRALPYAAALLAQNASLPTLLHCFNPSATDDGPWTAVTCAFGASLSSVAGWSEGAWLRAVETALADVPHAVYGRPSVSTTRYLAHNNILSSVDSYSSSSSSAQPSPSPSPSPHHNQPAHPVLFLAKSLLPVPILALYSFLFIWTFRSLQRFTQVHNRPGVAFTYVVELAASTTCSGSLCVMLGWKLEGVPWFLLPFVITVVGVENMIHVTNAIVTTPVHMTVRERLGLGLAQAGPRITFTTLADILILALFGTVLGETVGVVKEFCRFAIIVLVADWFLLFTFFTTVISIDMQRLELADVLRQDSPATPLVPADSTFAPASTPPNGGGPDPRARRRRRRGKPAAKSSSEVLVSGFQAILRARTARNGSLMALMSLLLGLWYFYSGGLGAARLVEVPAGRRLLPLDGPLDSTALWQLANPLNLPSLALTVPAPLAVVISHLPDQPSPAAYVASLRTTPLRSVFSDRAPLTWFLQVVCLPIAATTFVVYLILRYLLKDAELLDAQRDRLEIGEEWDEDAVDDDSKVPHQLQQPPTLRMLPTAHQADVSLLAISQTKLLSVGFDGIALVWSRDDAGAEGVPLPLRLGADRVTHAALDGPGRYCAIATARGAVGVWRLGSQLTQPAPVPFLVPPGSTPSAVSSIEFLPPAASLESVSATTAPPATLVIVRDNGEIVEVNCRRGSAAVQRPGSPKQLVRATPFWSSSAAESDEIDLALANAAGEVVVLRRNVDGSWNERLTIQLDAGERVSKVASTHVLLAGMPQDVLAVTTTSGSITLWDTHGARLIALNPNLHRLGRVALVDPGVQECAGCGQKLDGLLLVASNADEATLYRLTHEPVAATACACSATTRSMSTSTQRTSFDRLSFDASPLSRSRGPSMSALVPPVSPSLHRRMPTSLSTASNLSAADYPIAGHGVHSRRLSTRDRRAETEELLLDPDNRPQDDPFMASSSPDERASSPPPALRAVLLGSVSVRKGAWNVLETGQIVGVGRPRRFISSSSMQDDTSSVLSSATGAASAKWRVWQIDNRRPSHGLDLAVAVFDMQSLKDDSLPSGSDASPDDQASSAAEGSSALRHRRAARVKAFSRPSTTIAPSLAHPVVSPLVGTGDGVAFAGMGNSLCRLAFSATCMTSSALFSSATQTQYPPSSSAASTPNPRMMVSSSPADSGRR